MSGMARRKEKAKGRMLALATAVAALGASGPVSDRQFPRVGVTRQARSHIPLRV